MRRERGVVLFIALIVLVAMALAGIALVRSVDTGVLVAGNLAFKQGATAAADMAVESARSWLITNKDILADDHTTDGYYSTWQEGLDLTGNDPTKTDLNWASAGKALTTDAAGNTAIYIIHRMCQDTGSDTTNCVRNADSSAAFTGYTGRAGYGSGSIQTELALVFFRVTVRVTGPRNTVSYVQSVLY